MWSKVRCANDRVSRRGLLATLGAGLIATTAGCVHPRPPPQGILLQKGIYAKNENDQRVTVLQAGDNELNISDPLLQSKLPRANEPANTTIPESVHERLKNRYSDIFYYVEVKKLNEHGPLVPTQSGDKPRYPAIGGKPKYNLSREEFGKVISGDRIEYTVDMFDSRKMDTLTVIIRKGTVAKKQPISNDNLPDGVDPYLIRVNHGSDDSPYGMEYYATEDAYQNAPVGSKSWFGVIYENRIKPTIQTFRPDPYGNL